MHRRNESARRSESNDSGRRQPKRESRRKYDDAREMDVVKELARKASFSEKDLEELYDWIDEGWNWMKNGRRVLSLPEDIHHWGTVYDD